MQNHHCIYVCCTFAPITDPAEVCDGLSRALHGHWLRLCEVCAAAMADDKLRLEASDASSC